MNELFITGVELPQPHKTGYPFSIPAVQSIETISCIGPVTFLVGENGSGKSTIIESIAVAAGFNAEGGTKNYRFTTQDTTSGLAEAVTLVRGVKREKRGYFLRAESFYTTANYAENGTYLTPDTPSPLYFDGKRIHEQSHSEAFLSIIKDFGTGLYIFDEPESALSPQRQLSLLVSMHELVKKGAQFIIATHSPLLLAYPGATIYELSQNGIERALYEELEHVQLTRNFLNAPDSYVRRLLHD